MRSLTWFSAVAMIGFGTAAAIAANPQLQVVDKNCYVEVFDDTKFDADDPHVKIQGPAELSSLKNVEGKNWNNEIQSVIVGPNATVRAYKNKDFDGTEIAFLSNQRIPDLSKLDASNDIESMKVACSETR
jgi:hypothetical protein